MLAHLKNLTNRCAFRSLADTLLVATVIGLAVLYFLQQEYRGLVLNAFYIPIVLSALCMGWLRASGLALLGFIMVLCTTLYDWESANSTTEAIVIVGWGCTLGATSGIIGLVISSREFSWACKLAEASESALTDHLTLVPNRRAFDMELRQQLMDFRRYGRHFTVLMFDADRFKRLNDRFGHEVGDRVLIEIARTIREALRDVDFVARLGGEEFAVILPNTQLLNARLVAERIREDVERLNVMAESTPIRVTVSVGGTCPAESESASQLMKRADQYLYLAKQAGRNLVRLGKKSRSTQKNGKPEICSFHAKAQSASGLLDSVTGLPLVSIFVEDLRRRLRETERYKSTLTLCLLTFDNMQEFLNIDEAYAEFGLCHIVDCTRRGLRDTDHMTWYSNNTIAIFLPQTTREAAAIALQRVLDDVSTSETPAFAGSHITPQTSAYIADVVPGMLVEDIISSTLESEPIRPSAELLAN